MKSSLSRNNSKLLLYKSLLFWVVCCFPLLSQAKSLPDFSASFDVRVLGFKVGQAHHRMQCHNSDCLLTSEAKPPKWAQRFINESAVEKIKLSQQLGEFKWLEYKKYLTRRYEDRTEEKTYTIIRDEANKRIVYQEKNKVWPVQTHVYDVISLAYAIQFRLINQQPLKDLFLQSDKSQQQITFKKQNLSDEIDLPIEDELQTKRFDFHNDKISAKLWLIPKMNYFPGQIEIENKENDRTIVLELDKLKTH